MTDEPSTLTPGGLQLSLLIDIKSRLQEGLDAIPARQRSLLWGLLATIGVLVVGYGLYAVYDSIGTLEEQNETMHRALDEMSRKRGAYVQAKARERGLETRIGTSPLQLTGFLEQISKEAGLVIEETNPRSPELIGKKYMQQSVDVRITKVGLEPLLKFMRKVETYPANLVLLTELSLRSRDDKHQEFGVEMTVSTYEHAPKTSKKPSTSEGKSSEGGGEKNGL